MVGTCRRGVQEGARARAGRLGYEVQLRAHEPAARRAPQAAEDAAETDAPASPSGAEGRRKARPTRGLTQAGAHAVSDSSPGVVAPRCSIRRRRVVSARTPEAPLSRARLHWSAPAGAVARDDAREGPDRARRRGPGDRVRHAG